MAEVTVPLRLAREGALPPVCAMTGTSADGAIPIRVDRSLTRWRSPKVKIPLCKTAFRAWRRRQSVMVKTRFGAIALVVIALGFSARNALSVPSRHASRSRPAFSARCCISCSTCG